MNKTVLVTGSAKGIGKAIIIEFAKHGYNVAINYLTSEHEALDLKNTVEKLYGTQAIVVKADISKEEEVINMVDTTVKKFGKINVLVNNANHEQSDTYLDKTKEGFMRTLEVNVVGTFMVTKYVSKYMEDGLVINISSLDATDTYNELSIDYCASKAAINSLAQTFSLAIPNIKFISVMLPWVNTESVKEMFPEYLQDELKRTGQTHLVEPEEVSQKIYSYVDDNKIKSGSILKMKFN